MYLEITVVLFVPVLSFLLRNWDPRQLSQTKELNELREFVMQPLRSADTEENYSVAISRLSDSEEEVIDNSEA